MFTGELGNNRVLNSSLLFVVFDPVVACIVKMTNRLSFFFTMKGPFAPYLTKAVALLDLVM